MNLNEEQINFLIKLKTGPKHYTKLGDRLEGSDCDEKAHNMLKEMEKQGYVINLGNTFKIAEQGFNLVKDIENYSE